MLKKLGFIAAAVVAVSALFYYLTVSPVQLECEIVFEYKGGSVTARAAGVTREDALRAAVTVARGQLASGMTELIQCESVLPKSENCR